MKKQNTQCVHKSKIGGQALFEGVMMRGLGKEAMAVRKKDGSIYTEVNEVPANKWYQKAPFIRGVFNFIISMKNGYKYMMKSMELSGFLDEEEEDGGEPPQAADNETPETSSEEAEEAKEKKEPKKENEALNTLIGVLGMIGGVGLAIGLFMFLPTMCFTLIKKLFEADIVAYRSLIEGIIRIILFVGYMWAISLMKEIRVTYEYHGAEHKTIAAYEGGENLDPENVENVVKYSRLHPRCGTSFIFLVLAISILVYSILPINSETIASYFGVSEMIGNLIRTGFKLLLMPFLVGITYEIIKLAGRYDRNIFMRIISAPGLGLQNLTTKEPSKKQLQVAVAAMIPVIPEDKEEDVW